MAHRGGKFWESRDFSYIAESVRAGADIIELDVRSRNGEYVVQHAKYGRLQGSLKDAISYIGHTSLYLDIKDRGFDVNGCIASIRALCLNPIIVGSFDVGLLRSINDRSVVKSCHCLFPWRAGAKAREAGAQWVSPVCYFVTTGLARKIQDAGFRFVPSANLVFTKREVMRNQLRYAHAGVYAISTYHVKEMKRLLKESV